MASLYIHQYFVYASSKHSVETVCVGGGRGERAIFGPLYEIWVLIARGLKSDLKTVYRGFNATLSHFLF